MKAEAFGSVRVDLLGGTIDLNPINLILPNVVTLNLATSLKAHAVIEKSDDGKLHIVSEDYNSENIFDPSEITYEKLLGGEFGPLNFILQILFHENTLEGIKVTLRSGSPAGAGLGGSSAMGVTLFKAIQNWKKKDTDRDFAIKVVNSLEARILNKGPAGYQDYYPALHGGVLGLVAGPDGVQVDQLYSQELAEYLQDNLILVYSGQTRLSGINNWEVYKNFFDDKDNVREGLTEIGNLSYEAYSKIKNNNFSGLVDLISKEGETREKLFPNILTDEMKKLKVEVQSLNKSFGVKVCGAGGGGCFLITADKGSKSSITELVEKHGMKILPFKVEAPL